MHKGGGTMPIKKNIAGGLMYFRALTSLHPGAGTALGVVDLPVQRERHTNWPTIPGSSVKGILRDACEGTDGVDSGQVEAAFGKGGENDSSAGALTLTDARLLAFPVRSLKGVFAWVTCPQALHRWQRDANVAGVGVSMPGVPKAADDEALVARGAACLATQGTVVLEEYVFKTQETDVGFFPALDEEEKKRLVILSDTDFTHFVTTATEITARIRLNPETKTVAKGALFYQEFLPAETLLYSTVLATGSRRGQQQSAPEMLDYLRRRLPEYLQVGGDETTGKGICAVHLATGGGV